MRLLWVATKPPWPARDGGRLLLAETLRALARHGHEIHVVAPADAGAAPDASPAWPAGCIPHLVRAPAPSMLRLAPALVGGQPFSVARHARRPVHEVVARLVATMSFDAAHAEQLQAFAQCRPARARGIPLLLRAQNVESDLWAGVAACGGPWRTLAARECARIAAYEADAVRSATATIALTARDAERLRVLAGPTAVVHAVAAPFAADGHEPGSALPGAPAVVLLASPAWLPSADGARWFLAAVWATVRKRLPQARLHVFGVSAPRRWPRAGRARSPDDGVVFHPAPATSATAFPSGASLVVPLRIASGVRMKILEAWARGLPVVATPEASAGLDAQPGRELLVARDGAEFAAALAAIATDPGVPAALVRNARTFLRAHHDPGVVAAQLTSIAADAASATRARR